MNAENFLNSILPKETVGSITNHQRLFLRYTMAVLVDLTVLSFFSEFWKNVFIESFSVAFFAAILLQILLQLTIAFEHRLANYFKAKPGLISTIMRFFSSWAVLFFSKLIILKILNIVLGDKILFTGAFHGVFAFIVVVFAIIIFEQMIIRIYNALS